VAAVLDAVVADPSSALSLADLAARTGVNKATALGIVNELVAGGWLTRDDATKTYRPGPAMLAAGAAAQVGFASVRAARRRLQRLADETGRPVTASAVVRNWVTVLARCDSSAGGSTAFRVGQRYPFAPPSGVMFVAWDDDPAVDAWLRREPLAPLAVDEEQLRDVVASCRARGYLVVGLGELTAGLYALLDEVGNDELAGRLGQLLSQTVPAGVQPYLVDDIDADASYDVSLVCAPVTDADDRLDFLVAILVMRSHVSGGELCDLVAQLTAATADLQPR
jgi:DNA-binding IclR family transcriptional regulator